MSLPLSPSTIQPPAAGPMIVLRNVAVKLSGRTIIADISASVADGSLIAIIGPNGSGKSTLLRSIAGLIPVAAGDINVLGRSPFGAARRSLARHLCYLPQHTDLAFGFSVEEVVLLGRYAHQRGVGFADDADLRAAHEAMARCDVTHLATRRFDQLSGGEARRVLLAQALCQAATCLLLDEPTAAIDPTHARAIMQLVREQCDQGAIALLVTHDVDLALRYATEVWALDAGALVAQGEPAGVLRSAAVSKAFGLTIHVGALPSGQPFAVPA
ncbi:MAG: ABC transporter ATP-binding protein [Kofleriaceae bacterium]|nr:ABC transporter ATP-binding protein [Kofleriaceae bacterium]